MTVSSEVSSVSYNGNGSTQIFAVPFYFLDDSHLRVILRAADGTETVQTITTNYTVSGAGNQDGGSVTMLAAPASGVTLAIVRNVPATQETDYVANDPFPAESHERALDKLTMLIQQAGFDISRAIRVPDSDPEPSLLPSSIDRANLLLSFDSLGNPTAVAPSSGSATDLAINLANDTDPSKGAALVGYKGRTVYDKLNEVINIRDFGVVGDGVTDDTAAMADVFAYDGPVLGDPSMTVMIGGSMTITGSLKLDMRGGTIKMRSALGRVTINAQNVEFRNAVFDGNSLNVNVCFFRIPTTYNGWLFEGCTFQNIVGIAGSANQYGIWADLDAARFRVSNCLFDNISNVSNETPTSGFCGAMLLGATTTGCVDGRVEGVTVRNVSCSGIAGNINNSDADGIRVFGPQPTVQSNLIIRSINCIDVQKSGIKVSGNRGLIISDVNVYNDRSDVAMVAGVRFQAADYSTISNITLVGRMSVGVNIRSRNIIVDGVNYRPIDTARDTVASGLIQLQSDDAYVTQFVKVSNVVGDNVGQAFDFDTTGVTIATAFTFIEFHHWSVKALAVASAGTASRIQTASHVTLDHVYLWDAASAWINSITFSGVANFKAHYCRFEARREMFTWAPGDGGIEFDGCSFYRQDTATSENLRMLLLRDTSAGALDRVTVRNCTFSCPSYSAVGNQQCIYLNATNAVVDGVTIYVRSADANVSPPTGWVSGTGSGYKISDVKVSSESALTNGAGGYAVDLATTMTGSVVTDVMNNSGPGVRASAGANNNLIDTVAGKVTALANTGTGNTTGSTHILP